jgi:hypothetical protein
MEAVATEEEKRAINEAANQKRDAAIEAERRKAELEKLRRRGNGSGD